MKIGWNIETGLERSISSWKSDEDPAKGEYVVKVDLRGYPQVFVFKGSLIKFRVGPWNGQSLAGLPVKIPYCSQKFVLNEKEVYYGYDLLDSLEFISIFKLTPSGTAQRSFWRAQTNTRQVLTIEDQDQCENYAFCGENSICSYDGNRPTCECLRGYFPKSPDQWNMSISPNGCVPRNKSNCQNSYTDGFFKYAHMKMPDTSSSWFNTTMNLDECRKSCLKNCSCTAYANLDIRGGGSGCLLWFNNTVDMRYFPKFGQDIYIRVPASELDNGGPGIKKKIVVITAGVTVFGLIITCFCILIVKNPVAGRLYSHIGRFQWRQEYFILRREDMDLPTFELSAIAKATDNFSSRNKLGEGGFGPVYKGTLIDGQEVAVKRHSEMSDQGLEEFKNEVVLIAKLQHRNLVKLLGCCIHGEEKLLIYECMANKSLDCFIFDETRSKLLSWNQRFHIIVGIARGLLYLHQDSRLRIIHRDLKTSNILLDAHMNPKISDFGMARTFGWDQSQAKTRKVVGTYGYMPPEYAVHGYYSVKSDVFGFGVIVLEIVSGNKNRGFSDPEHSLNLLGHAWRLWTEDRPLELIDINLSERCIPFEVLRCIHVGLLCVQQKPQDRPDMSSVIPMLNGEKLLPLPKAPGFYTGNCTPELVSSSKTCNPLSQNEISLTIFEAR
ncbi:G-type lectin S-receptor-like serine/threonine-protein kinase SD1-1 [Glycine soja]|nr:G-type lectin S-receptor-like serine/threonine-protein kinase SD1-1 [Glycine soja]